MTYRLDNTTTREIAKALVTIRDAGGQVATGRVLTLIVPAFADDDIEHLVTVTAQAAREHPSRVLILVKHDQIDTPRLDCEIRVGGDAGASEIILMHLHGEMAIHRAAIVTPLLLPDTPIVAWWPGRAPKDLSSDPIGKIAQRRITDSSKDPCPDALALRSTYYRSGDSDMSWARITPWRGLVASTLEVPPHEHVTAVIVTGTACCPTVDLAAGWLADRFQVPVKRSYSDTIGVPVDEHGTRLLPIKKLELIRDTHTITVTLRDAQTVAVDYGNGQAPALVALARRQTSDCLAEELRHLGADEAYAHALLGLDKVHFADLPDHAKGCC